jgi:hypothetical protein
MLVTTHTLIATTIAVKTKNPYIYVPAALVNHFILDSLPHFGSRKIADSKSKFLLATTFDAVLGISVFCAAIFYFRFPPVQLFLIDLAAGWPDLINAYQQFLNGKYFVRFQNWHANIQKFEYPLGILIEITIWLFCFYLLFV